MSPIIGGAFSVAIFSFGTLFVVLGHEFPPFQFAAISYFCGFLSIVLIQKARGKLDLKSWKQPFAVYFTVYLGMGAYSTLLVLAFSMSAAFAVNILNYTWPVFWVILSAAMHRKIPKAYQLAGLSLGFVGMVCVFLGKGADFSQIALIDTGYLIVLAAAFIWAVYSVLSLKMSYKSDFLAPVILLSGFIALGLHFAFEETVLNVSPLAWMSVTALGLSRSVYVLWDYSIRRGDTVILSSLAYFTPLLSVAWFIFAGFTPANITIALAGFLIIAGCLVTNAGTIKKAYRKIKTLRITGLEP